MEMQLSFLDMMINNT